MMTTQLTLGRVMDQILRTGRITRAENNYLLRVQLMDRLLSREELQQVRQICDRLQMGLLKVVD